MSESGIVAELSAAVDGLLAVDTAAVGDDELGDVLVGLRREKARLCAAEAKLSRVFELRRAWRTDGSKSAGAWLKRHANCAGDSASRQFLFSRRLWGMPLTRDALAAAEIDELRAEILTKLANSPNDAIKAAFADSEELLVELAKTMCFAEFVKAIGYWKQGADPDGVEVDADKAADQRRLSMVQGLDGRWFLDGELDPVSGTIVHNELERLSDELFRDDWREAKDEHGDDVAFDKLQRTPTQRRADALVEMAMRSAAMPAHAKKTRPLVTVLVGYETFAGRVCELADGTVVAPGQLVSLLKADPWVERVVFDPKGKVVEVGSRVRLFEGATRRAVQVRDRTCAHAGCDEPAERCEVDHVVPYSDGGMTSAENGRLYCRFHHRWHHHHDHGDQPQLFTGTDPPTGPDG